MCQMSIVLKHDDKMEVILEDAALLKVTEDGILVNAMFEQPRLIKGVRISAIDFLNNRVTITETPGKD